MNVHLSLSKQPKVLLFRIRDTTKTTKWFKNVVGDNW